MTVDLNRTLTFLGKDPNWPSKVGIGALVSLVPLVNLAASGYAVNLFRNVLSGREDADVLPGWSDFGDHFLKGLVVFLIGLGYLVVPLGMLGFALAPLAVAFFTDSQPVLALGVAGTVLLVGLAILLTLVLGVLSVEGSALYAESGSFPAAFRFGEILRRILAAPLDFLLALGILFVGSLVASSVAGFIPFFGGFLAGALAFPVQLMFWHALACCARGNFLESRL